MSKWETRLEIVGWILVVLALIVYLILPLIKQQPQLQTSTQPDQLLIQPPELNASPLSRFLDPFVPPYQTPNLPWPYAYPDRQSVYPNFQQIGYLSAASDDNQSLQLLPLMGRHLNGARYQYYTVSDNDIKIPIDLDKKYDEISDEQEIELPGTKQTYKVFLYDTSDKWL